MTGVLIKRGNLDTEIDIHTKVMWRHTGKTSFEDRRLQWCIYELWNSNTKDYQKISRSKKEVKKGPSCIGFKRTWTWFTDLTLQVPMQYCSLQHLTLIPSPVTSTTGFYFCFGSVSSFFLELFLQWSPVAYWVPTTCGVHLSVSYLFAFSYCSWGSQGKNTEVACHSLLQWITFYQNSPPCLVHLGWPYMAWLIISLT